MRLLRLIIYTLLAIILLFLLIALFLSSSVHVDESVTIKTPASNITYQISNLKNWPNWTPFKQNNTDYKIMFEGPAEGIGAKHSWESKENGNGSIIIREIIPERTISGELIFEDSKKSLTYWEFEPVADNTFKLTWNIDVVDLSYPFGRWAGLFMSNKIHNYIQVGLNNLKNILENNTIIQNQTAYYKNSEITESELPSMIILSIKDSCKAENFSNKLKELYSEINNYILVSKAKQIAPPFAIYHSWNPKGLSVFEACIRINKYINSNDRIQFIEIPRYKVASIIHFGSYSTIGTAYNALEKYINTNNRSVLSFPREVYLTDPLREPDSTQWQTQVYYPIF